MIVYLAQDIPPFVMYCVNGKPCSSLLIESVSTDSMIYIVKVWAIEQIGVYFTCNYSETPARVYYTHAIRCIYIVLKMTAVCGRFEYRDVMIVSHITRC